MDQRGNNSRNQEIDQRILLHELENLRNPRIGLERGGRLRHDIKAEKDKTEAENNFAHETNDNPLAHPAETKTDGDENDAVIEDLFDRNKENDEGGSDSGPQRDRH